MFRTSDIVLIAVMVSAAALTYKTKHDAELQMAEMRRLQAQIRLEEETIDLLKADWSLLTQPVRLQTLADVYRDQLDLHPVEANQIVGPDEIPARPIELENSPSKALGGVAQSGRDGTTTGSIVQ